MIERGLLFGQILGLDLGVDVRLGTDLGGPVVTDAEDVRERGPDPLVVRNIHTGDACHYGSFRPVMIPPELSYAALCSGIPLWPSGQLNPGAGCGAA